MTSQVVLQAIISGILMGLIYALIAAGLSLIFGLMEIVNFAHGDHLMISMFSAFWFWMLFGIDPIYSIPLTILVMATLGVATHYFIIRKILNSTMLVQICATFGLAVAIRALAQFFSRQILEQLKIQLSKVNLKFQGFLLVSLNYMQV